MSKKNKKVSSCQDKKMKKMESVHLAHGKLLLKSHLHLRFKTSTTPISNCATSILHENETCNTLKSKEKDEQLSKLCTRTTSVKFFHQSFKFSAFSTSFCFLSKSFFMTPNLHLKKNDTYFFLLQVHAKLFHTVHSPKKKK